MPSFGDGSDFPVTAKTANTCILRAVIDIGATGAPTAQCDSGFTISRVSAGLYNITFPPIPDYTKTLPVLEGGINASAATTVAGCVPVAFAPGSGTAQIRFFLATPGTGVDPANGDQVWVQIVAGKSGSR